MNMEEVVQDLRAVCKKHGVTLDVQNGTLYVHVDNNAWPVIGTITRVNGSVSQWTENKL